MDKRDDLRGGVVASGSVVDIQAVMEFGQLHPVLAQRFAQQKIFVGVHQPGVRPVQSAEGRRTGDPESSTGESELSGAFAVEVDA